uniref:Hydroxyproline-rich protein n=1 Tax=Phaseolus vulgaris TaxID=3885 RepID=D2DW75_PHAVU|nr:hydroxyproline-rich protein [Phaseolus vulgaris]
MEKENMLKTLPKVPIQAQKPEPECKTPIPAQQQHQNKDRNSSNELRKPVTVTPDHLRVPKAFKYPERYTSPTDLMMSPITKGLLARTKRGGGGGAMLPPGKNQPKILDMPLKDVGTFQNKFPLQFDDKINNTT